MDCFIYLIYLLLSLCQMRRAQYGCSCVTSRDLVSFSPLCEPNNDTVDWWLLALQGSFFSFYRYYFFI